MHRVPPFQSAHKQPRTILLRLLNPVETTPARPNHRSMEPNPLSDRLISTSFDMVDQRAQKSGLRRGAPAPKARQRFKITRRPGSLLRWKAAPWSKQQSDADNAQLTWICEERWRRDVFSSARRERRPWRGPLRTKGKAEGSCCGPQGITYIHCPFRDRRAP